MFLKRTDQNYLSIIIKYHQIPTQIIDSDSELEEQEKTVKIEEELSDEPCQVCGRKDNLELEEN